MQAKQNLSTATFELEKPWTQIT